MKYTDIPENRKSFRQLYDIFLNGPTIRDIDFSLWYKYLTLIVDSEEYLGEDFPMYSTFQIKFVDLQMFKIDYSPISQTEYSFADNEKRVFIPGSITEFSKIRDLSCSVNYFSIKTAGNSPYSPGIELHFSDVEVVFLREQEKINIRKPFLTSKEKEILLPTR